MKEEILKFFKGEAEDSEESISKYARDASLFNVRPKLVLFPKDSEDIQNLIKWVNENKEKYPDLSVTARSAGTDMTGGPLNESIILDFTRNMGGIIEFKDDTVRVLPGTYYRDFEVETKKRGLLLPSYTASKNICALGGMIANNSGGEKTLVYGKTERYVEALKIVLADGKEYEILPLSDEELKKKISQNDFEGDLYKKIKDLIINNSEDIKEAKPNVSKNSSGYYIWNVMREDGKFDLNKLIVGSQGTLGIITEITLRLIKPKPYSKLMVVFIRDLGVLPNLVNKLLETNPESLESYDDKTFFLVLKYIYSFAKLLGLSNFFKLIWSLRPEALMTLRKGFPRLIILAEFTADTQEEADKSARGAMNAVKGIKGINTHLTKNDFEAKKYWTIRHEAFNLIRYHLKKQKSEPFIDDVIVRPDKLSEFYPALYKILEEHKDKMTFAVGGHSGDGNMHIYTLMNPKDPAIKDIIMSVSEKVYDLVVSLGGSITAEHNDGIIRTPYLDKMYGPKILEIFKEIKNIFDLKNIFNPGKKVPMPNGGIGTKEYISKHIA